ncbi:hypothetical protein IEQ34_005455 [Dendrobium chrysotoxum]|uniref:Uncharacterized protein n=1 Tax=Dendrobium chrysotoxum TaxID=161865 RepID=A0AAV7HA74_DENCH|nr:hypothetical protein IEQ34_005455 [Dendrobium chrysotoxum]
MVRPRDSAMERSMSTICNAELESSPEVGSSRMRTAGSWTASTAIETRRRSPPDIELTRKEATWARPSSTRRVSTRVWMAVVGRPRRKRAVNARVSRTREVVDEDGGRGWGKWEAAGEELEKGGLASTAWSDDSKDLPGLGAASNVVEDMTYDGRLRGGNLGIHSFLAAPYFFEEVLAWVTIVDRVGDGLGFYLAALFPH